MVAPITGPFSQTVTAKGPPSAYGYLPDWLNRTRVWSRQRKPFTVPLGYSLDHRQIIKWKAPLENVQTANVSGNCYLWQNYQGVSDAAYNRAYASFRDDVYNAASLAVALAERKQAMSMIARRAVQLTSFVNDLRRLRFDKAATTLGLTSVPKGLQSRKGPKALANNYLEFHFGWSPLIADMYRASEILSDGIPKHLAVGRGASVRDQPEFLSGSRYDKNRHESKARIQAEVRIDNPNLALATQMGVTNPAIVAWELVPFSFVVDWFVNVSDFLNSFTDFAGYTIVNPQRYTINKITSQQRYVPAYPYVGMQVTALSVFATRSTGSIPGPKLRVRDPWVLSPRRAAAAVSLLIQRLPSR
jgi:hypothetical protein